MTNRSYGEWIKDSKAMEDLWMRATRALAERPSKKVVEYCINDVEATANTWLGQLSYGSRTTTKQTVPICKKIIHSGPCTIVFWDDNTKTVVRCSENDTYDEYSAFCAALAIKIFGSNSHLKKEIERKTKK